MQCKCGMILISLPEGMHRLVEKAIINDFFRIPKGCTAW